MKGRRGEIFEIEEYNSRVNLWILSPLTTYSTKYTNKVKKNYDILWYGMSIVDSSLGQKLGHCRVKSICKTSRIGENYKKKIIFFVFQYEI